MKYIKTCHKVKEARWVEAEGSWNIVVEQVAQQESFNDRCDILVNAGGYLNNWAWPNIPRVGEYEGSWLHSANWDDGVDLRDKKVGLIGNG